MSKVNLFQKFVRGAPQYQHMPNSNFLSPTWRLIAGWMYFLKQQLIYGQTVSRKCKNTKKLRNQNIEFPILVIGNGPSQRDLNRDEIEAFVKGGGKVLVMNGFDRTTLATWLRPDYYLLIDPAYNSNQNPDTVSILKYLEKNQSVSLVTSATFRNFEELTNIVYYINTISAVGLWRKTSPLLPSVHPQGVLFAALEFAIFLGSSHIYVVGVDQSHYLHHRHNRNQEVIIKLKGLHAYDEQNIDGVGRTNSFLTRNMADVLFAHAIFLRDLGRLNKKAKITNVAVTDETNDAFEFGSLQKIINFRP